MCRKYTLLDEAFGIELNGLAMYQLKQEWPEMDQRDQKEINALRAGENRQFGNGVEVRREC